MSGNYSAGQFNEPFKARRLRNWHYGINHPGKYSSTRKCPTQFIADNRGYLLCNELKDPRTSPWGDYRLSIWEESGKCDCVDRIRHPESYDRPPCSIVITRQRPTPTTEAKMTSAALAKTLFRPAPKPEVSVVVKDDKDEKLPEEKICDDRSSPRKQSNNKGSKDACDSNQNEKNNCQQDQTNSASLAVDVNPQAFPCGVVVDTDISQLQNGAIVDIGPTNNQNTCNACRKPPNCQSSSSDKCPN